MKKILFVIDSLDGGGAERVLINILNNINFNKYKVDLLLLINEGVYIDKLNESVKLRYIINKSIFKKNSFLYRLQVSISLKIIKILSKLLSHIYIGNKYDIEIGFLEGISSLIVSNSPNKKSKKICWIHNNMKKHNHLTNNIDKQIYKSADEIICVSNDSKRIFIDLYPEYEEKTKVIYNLINKEEIINLSKENIKINKSTSNIVAVGRLAPVKRFDLLIKAFGKLIDEQVDAQLTIVGDGPQKNHLEKLIKKLNLEDKVNLIGFKKNPYPYIKQSDVFVISSDYEGLPLVVAEAIILGKAIVSTRCTGPLEMLDNGKYGIVVDTNDYVALANGIKEILINEDTKLLYENKSLERSYIFDQDCVMSQIYNIL